MKLDKVLLKKIAVNSRLNLTEKEEKEFLPQLKEILKVFSELDKVDTKGVKPSFQPIPVKDAMREDIVEPSLTEEGVFLNVKSKKEGYFKGPKAV